MGLLRCKPQPIECQRRPHSLPKRRGRLGRIVAQALGPTWVEITTFDQGFKSLGVVAPSYDISEPALWSSAAEPVESLNVRLKRHLAWPDVPRWTEPWNGTDSWHAGFQTAWRLAGSPQTFALTAETSALSPYDLKIYIADTVPSPSTPETTLAWVVFDKSDYYAKPLGR